MYFYVRSITVSDFNFKRRDIWHFASGILYVFVKLIILGYNASQSGFEDTQNGYLVQNFQWKYVEPFVTAFSYL
jgi:hypothetical protein